MLHHKLPIFFPNFSSPTSSVVDALILFDLWSVPSGVCVKVSHVPASICVAASLVDSITCVAVSLCCAGALFSPPSGDTSSASSFKVRRHLIISANTAQAVLSAVSTICTLEVVFVQIHHSWAFALSFLHCPSKVHQASIVSSLFPPSHVECTTSIVKASLLISPRVGVFLPSQSMRSLIVIVGRPPQYTLLQYPSGLIIHSGPSCNCAS